MSNKMEATFHGPPSDPWPPLPQRQPFQTLADWDGECRAQAERYLAEPAWIKARRRDQVYALPHEMFSLMIGQVGGTQPPPPPPPPPPPHPEGPKPAWYHRSGPMGLLIGTVVWLFVFGMLALVMLVGAS